VKPAKIVTAKLMRASARTFPTMGPSWPISCARIEPALATSRFRSLTFPASRAATAASARDIRWWPCRLLQAPVVGVGAVKVGPEVLPHDCPAKIAGVRCDHPPADASCHTLQESDEVRLVTEPEERGLGAGPP
jgi:hypothetical protein